MWFCCLLGAACVLFGIDGIYTSFSQEASSVRFEWLGFGYVRCCGHGGCVRCSGRKVIPLVGKFSSLFDQALHALSICL